VAGFSAPTNLPGEEAYKVDVPAVMLKIDDGRGWSLTLLSSYSKILINFELFSSFPPPLKQVPRVSC